MGINNRQDFITKQASEKITLAHIEGSKRFITWTNDSGDVYYKDVPYFCAKLFWETTELTMTDLPLVGDNVFHYDINASRVYVRLSSGVDPNDEELIGIYRFFYSDAPVATSWNLQHDGLDVRYQGRIQKSPGYKHKIGVEQNLVSLVGSGDLILNNNDGALDDIFDTVFFENKTVEIYSWNRNIPISEAKKIFRGKVTDKKYTEDKVTFRVKDSLFELLSNIPQGVYSDSDNVNDEIKGNYKRWIYGRVDGLKLQSTDQTGSGILLTGTVTGNTTTETLTGTGTIFLTELSPGDTLEIGTQEFSVESIQSDTELTLDSKPEFAFNDLTALYFPEIPVSTKNRNFLVAEHACAKVTKSVVEVIQLNRIKLNNTVGLDTGDLVQFPSGETIEIKNIDTVNDIIILQQNLIITPGIGAFVVRPSVQEIYINGNKVTADNFTVTNNSSGTSITISNDAEFDLARTTTLGFDATFTNGSRIITTADDIDLREILSPRDWIRPDDISYSTFYEILAVDETQITLRQPFGDPNFTGPTEGKRPDYIGDDTIVSANVLGKTDNGEPEGEWLKTAAQIVRDLIKESGIPDTEVNESSFLTGAIDNRALISMALPLSPESDTLTIKGAIDRLSQSTTTSITLDNDLKIKFKALYPEVSDNIIYMRDEDVIEWKIKNVASDAARYSIVRYRFQDVDRNTLESGNKAVNYDSEFVEKYVNANKTITGDYFLYDDRSAEILSHRLVLYKALARAELEVKTDLRFENLEIGDTVVVDFKRFYKRLGDQSIRQKVVLIIGKVVTGDRIVYTMTDFSNIYNRSAIITPNDAPDYSVATAEEKIKYGYITDNRGIVDNDEDTANLNVIV